MTATERSRADSSSWRALSAVYSQTWEGVGSVCTAVFFLLSAITFCPLVAALLEEDC